MTTKNKVDIKKKKTKEEGWLYRRCWLQFVLQTQQVEGGRRHRWHLKD